MKPQMKYKVRKFDKKKNETIIVTIALDDGCVNGHADFSITASIYKGSICSDRCMISGGCIHDALLAVFPEFKPFVDLHLSDMYGAPMHAIANGFYHLRNKDKSPEERKAITKEYMRVDNAQFDILNTAKDKDYFHFLVENMGLPIQWLAEAQAGIVQLEKLTGEKWDADYKWKRTQYTPLTAKAKAETQQRLDSGYYTPAAIQKRRDQAEKEAYNKKIAEIKADAAKAIAKITLEKNLFLWLHAKAETLKKKYAKRNIEFRLFIKNCIYYNHINELKFNWMDRNYAETTPDNFKRFMNSITEADFQTKLPRGISIIIGEK